MERRKGLRVPAAHCFDHGRDDVERRAIVASPHCIDPDVGALAEPRAWNPADFHLAVGNDPVGDKFA